VNRVIFENALLRDGSQRDGGLHRVVVDAERIRSVERQASQRSDPDARVVDLHGRTLMPGMFSCHFHGTFEGATLEVFPLGIDKPPGYLMLRAARQARRALDAGFTSVIGAGVGDDIDAQLAMAIEDGLVPGPRITPSSRNLGTPGGYVDIAGYWWELGNQGSCRIAEGVEGLRSAVRDEVKRGAKIIKIFASGGHGGVEGSEVQFAPAELEAVVAAAHERGAKVRAHVSWKREILQCVRAGVDVVDHGDALDAECIEAMVASGTFLVPSLVYLERFLQEPSLAGPEHTVLRDAAQRELDNMLLQLPDAQVAGVRIVLGDDYGVSFLPHGSYAEELSFYEKRAGIAPRDILRWATANGAAMAGRAADLGRIEEGMLADLLVVDGDVEADLALLSDPNRLLAIMKDGVFHKDALAS
jgi:imidazolonepropionase-like amidohydrolase